MPRPLQNRVLATGQIVATPERGLFMGNRGILHDENQRLSKARWRHKAWIICDLVWKDWHRKVMSPGHYTELFFLDEAVALAAGHRPCALCRRKAYVAYRAAAGFDGPAAKMDATLHTERAIPRKFTQKHHHLPVADLPDGAIILERDQPKLLMGHHMFAVAPGGYGPSEPIPSGQANVLTPPSSLRALRNGYRPKLHPSLAASSVQNTSG